ncbi:sigma-54-dependent Fis family transcriptional regulator [Cupriavidus sp. USMAA2-4]|uniref:sigma-54-dependent Fis family transcriptional regulator n=1 Tax=Cupriavidus sp. USMAA2-4 TaxID=876364 RepID=UPI0008A6BFCF|nr:sigma-54-dependent Fis family transcriptional regulator [Cupriavidus sp. USMAA2-4]AOY96659.1 sigma-54-dependent Fis family transcriptional regulator [Cupriavidus sp. USMAA2-4]
MRQAADSLPLDVRTARRQFFDGRLVPPGTIPERIASSWQRAATYGLRPGDRALGTNFVTHSQLRRLEAEHQALIACAEEDMAILAGAFPSRHWLVFCTNAEGVIVSSTVQGGAGPSQARALVGGKRVSEAALGTNAPACVLSEGGLPIEIRRGEHYLEELIDVVCAAAPIHDPHDRLVGVLDITGFGIDLPAYALSRVQAAAMSIENRMYAGMAGCRILRLHHDPRMLGTPAEGIVAISRDDVIVAANRAARQMLGRPGGTWAPRALDEVFAGGLRAAAAGATGAATLNGRGGERYFVALEPAPAPTRAQAATPGAGAPRPSMPAAAGAAQGCVLADARLARLFGKAATVLREQVPVILLGETGTGKSMLARALHEASRPGRAFVSLNCSAIPEGLAEAELFGYEEGAFTGGRKGGSIGKIEQASHGTLFLDEIGDMPLALQARLLSVLQDRSVTRVGGHRAIPVDISVICATHRDLPALVRAGAFREDLLYRLNGLSVQVPALRERTDLAELIQAQVDALAGGRRKRLDADAMALLMAHAWPGNVRELHQALRAALALSGGGETVGREHFDETWLAQAAALAAAPPVAHLQAGMPAAPGAATAAAAAVPTRSTMLADLESETIERTLSELGGNRAQAARVLGISRATLYRKLARLQRG